MDWSFVLIEHYLVQDIHAEGKPVAQRHEGDHAAAPADCGSDPALCGEIILQES